MPPRAGPLLLAVLLAGCLGEPAPSGEQAAGLNVNLLNGAGPHQVDARNASYFASATGFLARPVGVDDAPGVVMIHEWWGLNDPIRDMARVLASHGYQVLAVDLFDGAVATTPEEALAQVRGLDQARATENMQAATRLLKDAGAPAVASLGWCFGGGQSLRLATSGEPLAATVIYYGSLDTDPANLSIIAWPVLGIFGEEDTSIPVSEVEAFDAALGLAGVDREIVIYPGVGHAFANPSREAYAPEPAKDAWAKTLAFLDEHLGR